MCVYQGNSYGEANDSQEIAFDLGVFVGDLNFEEDVSRYTYFLKLI